MESSDRIEKLKTEWMFARKLLEATRYSLRQEVVAACPIKLGDKVEVLHHSKPAVGRVTNLIVSVSESHSNSGEVEVEVRPIVYPIKKDGRTSKVGEIYLYNTDIENIKVLERDGELYKKA